MLQKPNRVGADVFRQVFLSVNLPDLVDTTQGLVQLIRRGYEYNGWQLIQSPLD